MVKWNLKSGTSLIKFIITVHTNIGMVFRPIKCVSLKRSKINCKDELTILSGSYETDRREGLSIVEGLRNEEINGKKT